MRYDFIAEFFAKPNDENPIYRTHINGIEYADRFIQLNNFTKASNTQIEDYILETDMDTLVQIVSMNINQELLTIRFEGRVCNRVRINAYEYHAGEGSFIGFGYGENDKYRVVFEGNNPDDKVIVNTCGGPISIPLHYLKDHYKVLTLFEVIERLQKRINDVLENGP